jgi:hypothetical protein
MEVWLSPRMVTPLVADGVTLQVSISRPVITFLPTIIAIHELKCSLTPHCRRCVHLEFIFS